MKLYERIENNNFDEIDRNRAIELIEGGNGHLVYNENYFKLQKENEELKEYIVIAPNLDKMTATKYRNIQQDAYIQGRTEEQQKAKQIIYENYIPIQKIKDKIEELNNISNAEKLEDIMIGGKYTITELVQYVLQELIEERKEK